MSVNLLGKLHGDTFIKFSLYAPVVFFLLCMTQKEKCASHLVLNAL